MRKNVKQQFALRVLSTAALMAMVSSIATAAFADTYDLNKGSVTVETKEDGFTYVTQLDNTQTDGYARNDNEDILHDYKDTTGVTVTSKGKPTENTITVDTAKDQTTDVTLQDVHIETEGSWNNTGSAPIEIKGNGDTNLELNGDNTVLSGDSHHAAIEKADKNGTGTLTIKDDLNDDNSTPKDKDENGNAAGGDTGKLLAGGYGDGAGIGGGSSSNDLADTSNITIKGGEITARGGCEDGAGIGGGTYGNAKNIRIEGNAHVTASGDGGAGIGGGTGGNDVTITGNAVVDAYSEFGSAIGDGRPWGGGDTTITISGNATVHAETSQAGCAIGSGYHGDDGDLTINIEENANVTAIASYGHPAIGNATCHDDGTTTINITGGTVNAITSYGPNDPSYPDDGSDDHSPAIGAVLVADRGGACNVNINSSTGDTVVNAYIYGKGSGPAVGSVIRNFNLTTYEYEYQDVPADSASYKADGSSYFGERNSAIVNCYNNGTVPREELNLPSTNDPNALRYHGYSHKITGGTLTKVVHNRKYMEEHPEIVDITKLKDEDLHDWKLVKRVEPTLDADGYADYICSIDKCGQTKHVVLPKLTPEPSEPDTPNKPDTPDTPDTPSTPDVPSTPEVTPADPAVTPDAPAQDGTAPADTPAADTTAAAQNVAQNAEPKAAAAAPAALPQTGANWLAVVGTALSGLFLLAAGFVLDRKNRRMN